MKKKKFSWTVALLTAIAIWIIGFILVGCSQYTCPTYSQQSTPSIKTLTRVESDELSNIPDGAKAGSLCAIDVVNCQLSTINY